MLLEPGPDGNSTALAAPAVLTCPGSRRQGGLQPEAQGGEQPALRLPRRQGARRLAVLTLGDRYQRMKDAQALDNRIGRWCG
jgi:hypothetical protein